MIPKTISGTSSKMGSLEAIRTPAQPPERELNSMDKPQRQDENSSEIQPRIHLRPGAIQLPGDVRTELHLKTDSDVDNDEFYLGTDDAQSVVGFSIGREQARLLSPTTPAIERTAALDASNKWGFFDGTAAEDQEALADSSTQETPLPHVKRDSSPDSIHEESRPTHVSLPSPWVSTATSSMKAALDKDHIKQDSGNRSRTDSTGLLGDLNFKRFFSSLSFPTVGDSKAPKDSKKLSATHGKEDAPQAANRRSRASTLWTAKPPWSSEPQRNSSREEKSPSPRRGRPRADSKTPPGPQVKDMEPTANGSQTIPRPGAYQVRDDSEIADLSSNGPSRSARAQASDTRSISELSRISSLGDDSRWENLDSQVNSRFKAIRDSLQDNLPDMPNIKLSALRPDFVLKKLSDVNPLGSSVNSAMYGNNSEAIRQEPSHSTRQPSPPRALNSKYPSMDDVADDLTGDIVILGGYRGSILRSSEVPHRQLWVPLKVGLNIRKVNLELGLADEDEENEGERIFSSGMLQHVGPVDISRRLFKKLRQCRNAREGRLRVHDFGYDWRLSPDLISRRLIDFLCSLGCNQPGVDPAQRGATVIAHSLGGSITRHAVNRRPELFAGVLYAGTPQHCVNILGPLRDGDAVLLSSKVLTAQTNFTIRSSFALLPESGECFIDRDTKEHYPVNFFDVEEWKRYAFSPCVATCLPPLQTQESRRGLLSSLHALSPSNPGSSLSTPAPSPRPPSEGLTPPPSLSSPVKTATVGIANKAAENLPNPAADTLGMTMSPPPPSASATSIPASQALSYLERTLKRSLAFKRSLAHSADLQKANAYPPHAVIYATNVPTVYGARVRGRAGIARSDAYENLAFASGDGVVLARASMLPEGYKCAKGGRVRTERGHVGMLGDLEAVGRCLAALIRARREGVGLGKVDAEDESVKEG